MGKCWIISWMSYHRSRIFRCAFTLKDKPQLFWLIIIFRCCLIGEAISGAIILVPKIGIQERSSSLHRVFCWIEGKFWVDFQIIQLIQIFSMVLRTMDKTPLNELEKWKMLFLQEKLLWEIFCNFKNNFV